MTCVYWRSWSRGEAQFELTRLKENVPLQNVWINAHDNPNPGPNDIWLTTNGYDWMPHKCRKITWYAESFIYLANEYNNYANNKWDHRFHFNPNYANQKNSSLLNIHCWWKRELKTFIYQKPTHLMGMVQGKKPDQPKHPADFGYFRNRVVQALRGRSFYYHGTAWPSGDPNYKGESYVAGQRSSPLKFNDARILLRNAKFTWALENCHDQHYSLNYMTEKIFHGFLSGGVPIYCGAGNIEKIINPNLFIDLRKFNYDINAVYDFCEKMPDSEYKGYQDRISEFLNGEAAKFSCDSRFQEIDKFISA